MYFPLDARYSKFELVSITESPHPTIPVFGMSTRNLEWLLASQLVT